MSTIHRRQHPFSTADKLCLERPIFFRKPLAPWASYQIHNIAGCACAGNAGNVFPRRRFQRKPLVSDPGMRHGTCVTHVPWCMSGSLASSGGKNVPGIPGACANAICHIWQEAHSGNSWPSDCLSSIYLHIYRESGCLRIYMCVWLHKPQNTFTRIIYPLCLTECLMRSLVCLTIYSIKHSDVVFTMHITSQECCTRSSLQRQGQLITSHSISGK